MDKSILLLGGVLPAVQLLRRIQAISSSVHVIAQENDAIAFSRYGVKYLYVNTSDSLSIIHQWISDHEKTSSRWLVIPCSEFYVKYIKKFRDNGFDVFAPSCNELNVFCDKSLMYEWLNCLGVKISKFSQLDDSLDFSNDKRYIIKLSKSPDGYKAPFKTKIIYNEMDFQLVRRAIPRHFWSNFIIQPLYKNNQSISYGSVWVAGKEVVSLMVMQIRQYPRGVTSNAVKVTDSEDIRIIREVVAKIASEVKLHGFIELEFIKSEAGLYPIDLNPRLWGWSNFLFHRYPNILSVFLRGERKSLVVCKKVVSWSNVWRDIPAIFISNNSIFDKIKLIFSLFFVSSKDFVFFSDIKPEFSSFFKRYRGIKR